MPTKRRTPNRSPRRTPRRAAPTKRAAAKTRLPIYQVDAFTGRLFHGNPAAVVLLEGKWPSGDVLASIAAENNLAETAFVLRSGAKSPRAKLRWFTPTVEVDLCGHATLAAAHVLWNHTGLRAPKITFDSASGPLHVTRDDGMIVLDFPSRPGRSIPISNALCAALGHQPVEAYKTRDILAVFGNRREIYDMKPDFEALARLDALGVIVTAPGSGHDFVSRFFAPAAGIPEDPVTGSAHCTLIPYWSKRLGKTHLTAHQVSKRGGELACTDRGKRVSIAGHAVTFLQGTITV